LGLQMYYRKNSRQGIKEIFFGRKSELKREETH
jgi:hypothetical protein